MIRNEASCKSLWQRLGWLVLIWSASVLSLGMLAWLLRQFMNAAGLGTP
ncbi:DUF2474 domain-containing protein [Pseudomonas sp. NCCP-436]|nr:DUF2474 domain-containing protein [Pseudomonas sp. NCCP-436]